MHAYVWQSLTEPGPWLTLRILAPVHSCAKTILLLGIHTVGGKPNRGPRRAPVFRPQQPQRRGKWGNNTQKYGTQVAVRKDLENDTPADTQTPAHLMVVPLHYCFSIFHNRTCLIPSSGPAFPLTAVLPHCAAFNQYFRGNSPLQYCFPPPCRIQCGKIKNQTTASGANMREEY
jgi:hypothetical protein